MIRGLTRFDLVSATVTGSSTPSFVRPLTFKSSLCSAFTSLIIWPNVRVRVRDSVKVKVGDR